MDIENRQFAEKALNQIFNGSQLDGINFGVGPGAFLIRFEQYSNKTPDSLWLNIESRWAVFPKETEIFPNSETEMDELSEEEEYKLVYELRREKVTGVRLGSHSPHLYIDLNLEKRFLSMDIMKNMSVGKQETVLGTQVMNGS